MSESFYTAYILDANYEKIGYGVYTFDGSDGRKTVMEFKVTESRTIARCNALALRWRDNCNAATAAAESRLSESDDNSPDLSA